MDIRATRTREARQAVRCAGGGTCQAMAVATERYHRERGSPGEAALLVQSILSGRCPFCHRPVR